MPKIWRALEGQATGNTAKFKEHWGKIKKNEAAISSNAARLEVIENKMKELESALLKEGDTLQDLKKKMDLLDKAAEEGTLAGVSAEAWEKLSADMYEAKTREIGRLKIERHQSAILIF